MDEHSFRLHAEVSGVLEGYCTWIFVEVCCMKLNSYTLCIAAKFANCMKMFDYLRFSGQAAAFTIF